MKDQILEIIEIYKADDSRQNSKEKKEDEEESLVLTTISFHLYVEYLEAFCGGKQLVELK